MTVDQTPPTSNFTSGPSEGDYEAAGPITLAGTSSDDHYVFSVTGNVTIGQFGLPVQYLEQGYVPSTNWTLPIPSGPYETGTQPVSVSVITDNVVGITATITRNFTIDNTPPTVGITYPTPNSLAWSFPNGIQGTAADDVALNGSVLLTIQELSTGKFWNGSGFVVSDIPIQVEAPVSLDASGASGTWSYPDLTQDFLSADSSYSVTATAFDEVFNQTSVSSNFTFGINPSLVVKGLSSNPNGPTVTIAPFAVSYGQSVGVCAIVSPSSFDPATISFPSVSQNGSFSVYKDPTVQCPSNGIGLRITSLQGQCLGQDSFQAIYNNLQVPSVILGAIWLPSTENAYRVPPTTDLCGDGSTSPWCRADIYHVVFPPGSPPPHATGSFSLNNVTVSERLFGASPIGILPFCGSPLNPQSGLVQQDPVTGEFFGEDKLGLGYPKYAQQLQNGLLTTPACTQRQFQTISVGQCVVTLGQPNSQVEQDFQTGVDLVGFTTSRSDCRNSSCSQ